MPRTESGEKPYTAGGTVTRTGAPRCFSLVELVIVIVLIGVIAAIAIPRLSSGATGSGDAALKQSLKVLRDAIERYAAEHGGDFPAFRADPSEGHAANSEGAFQSQLTRFSSRSGATSGSASGASVRTCARSRSCRSAARRGRRAW
jgi:type II secretory pathway pseudopilin PulG